MALPDALHARGVPTVQGRCPDERLVELPGQARCLAVPEHMDRRQPAVTQDDAGTKLIYPHVTAGYLELSTAAARPLSAVEPGAEALVEMPGEGLWRAIRVEGGGFCCPAHQVRMELVSMGGGARLACPRCEVEQRQVATGAALPGEQVPGIHAVTGYAWLIRPLDDRARLCAEADVGGEARRYGYGAGEVPPADGAEHLCDLESMSGTEHLVVTQSVQAPSVPRCWGIEPVRPLRPRMLSADPARPAFAVKPAGPVEEMLDWSLQRWVFGVGA